MLRMPDGMRGRLKEIADQNSRSMNSEIVSRLEQTLFQDDILASNRAAEERNRLRREAGELVPNAPAPPPPESLDDYGHVRVIPASEKPLAIDIANEEVREAISATVRAAVDDAMSALIEETREGSRAAFMRWFEHATASLEPDGPEAQLLLDELRSRLLDAPGAGEANFKTGPNK